MDPFQSSLPIDPQILKSDQDMPRNVITKESTAKDESIVRLTVDSRLQMDPFQRSLPIIPRLHKSERGMPPTAITKKSTTMGESIVRLKTSATHGDDRLESFDSSLGIHGKNQNKFNYRKMQSSRARTQDTSDPFARPLE